MENQLGALSGAFNVIFLIVGLFIAYCLMKIAQREKVNHAWIAFIPVANIFLMLKLAGLSYWFFILFFVPLANIIILVLIWMKIAERLGSSKWLGLLMLLPLVNLGVIIYLAFAKPSSVSPAV